MKPIRWFKFASLIVSLALAASLSFAPALAYSPTHFFVAKLTSGGCAPGTPLRVNAEYRIELGDYASVYSVLTNLRTGESRATTLFTGVSGLVVDTYTGPLAYTPAGVVSGDRLRLTVTMPSYLGYGSVHTIEFRCNNQAIYSNKYDDTGGDYRINGFDAEPGPVALYCKANNDLDIYTIDWTSGASQLALRVPKATIDAVKTGSQHQLIAQQGAITLWRLNTGEVQLNAPYGDEKKVYVFIFGGCPYDGSGYTIVIDPAG